MVLKARESSARPPPPGNRRVLAEEGRKELVFQRRQLSCPREGWKWEGETAHPLGLKGVLTIECLNPKRTEEWVCLHIIWEGFTGGPREGLHSSELWPQTSG